MSTLAFSKEENDSLAFSDVPQDLSAKVKTVSVQTDSNHDSVIRDLLSGFSEKQVRLLLGVLSQFLWRNNQEIPEDSENLIINGLQKELITHPRTRQQPLSSGWTPLEPETPPISPPLNSLLNHVSSTAPRNLLHPTPWSSAEVSPYQQHQQTTKSFKQETNVRINNFGSQTLSHARHECYQRISTDDEKEDSLLGISRDEKLVQDLNIPCSVDEIIHKPMEEFNDILSKHSVSEEVINICRDIRRRGKNKIAAQNCRKRKVEQIYSLEEDLQMARSRKKIILSERAELLRQQRELGARLVSLERSILRSEGKPEERWRIEANMNLGKISFIESRLAQIV